MHGNDQTVYKYSIFQSQHLNLGIHSHLSIGCVINLSRMYNKIPKEIIPDGVEFCYWLYGWNKVLVYLVQLDSRVMWYLKFTHINANVSNRISIFFILSKKLFELTPLIIDLPHLITTDDISIVLFTYFSELDETVANQAWLISTDMLLLADISVTRTEYLDYT